jgi:nucleoid DNA-binding protein
MTRADLVDKITGPCDLTHSEGLDIVNTVLDAMIDAIKSGDKTEIRGFGSFRTANAANPPIAPYQSANHPFFRLNKLKDVDRRHA